MAKEPRVARGDDARLRGYFDAKLYEAAGNVHCSIYPPTHTMGATGDHVQLVPDLLPAPIPRAYTRRVRRGGAHVAVRRSLEGLVQERPRGRRAHTQRQRAVVQACDFASSASYQALVVFGDGSIAESPSAVYPRLPGSRLGLHGRVQVDSLVVPASSSFSSSRRPASLNPRRLDGDPQLRASIQRREPVALLARSATAASAAARSARNADGSGVRRALRLRAAAFAAPSSSRTLRTSSAASLTARALHLVHSLEA